MKKRAKIITTIASLCLAVALMAFGVYAANEVSVGITSKVNFVVTDVFVTVTGKAYLSSGTTTNDDLVPVSGEVLANTIQAQSYQGTIGSTATVFGTLKTYSNSTWVTNNEWNFGTITFTSDKGVITYIVTIQNDDPVNSVYIDIEVPTTGQTAQEWTAANITTAAKYSTNNATPDSNVAISSAVTDKELEGGKTMTITVSYTLADFSTALDELDALDDWNITISHTAAA